MKKLILLALAALLFSGQAFAGMQPTSPPAASTTTFGLGGNTFGRQGTICFANGTLSGRVAQLCFTTLRGTTTSTTATRLTTDGTGTANAVNCVNIPAGLSAALTYSLAAIDATNPTNLVSFPGARAALYRSGVVTTTVALSQYAGSESGIGTGSSVAVPVLSGDTTNGCLNFSVTAPNADTWDWTVTIISQEVQ